MSKNVTIVMYHYVRDLAESRYPEIKGLEFSKFKEQVLFLKKHYRFITMETLVDSIENNTSLPDKAVLLTFDDGYIDHFTHVFPFLNQEGIQGCFFPPAKAIAEHKVLDVNKIHFILASQKNKSVIVDEISRELALLRNEHSLEQDAFYYEKLAHPSRYDTADVIYIKRLLQVELSDTVRSIVTDNLFKKFVEIEEGRFARELYLSMDQIRCMHRNGMYFGSHGYAHNWLGSLTMKGQREEIEKSLSFLNDIGTDPNYWTMCYPYGNYNEDTVSLLKTYKCRLALTTKVGTATVDKASQFTLARLDTNDLPKDRDAEVNQWYAGA